MTALADDQWELSYDGLSSPYVFGTPGTGLYLAGPPDLGAPEVSTDDFDRPREDGRSFGQDFLGGQTITFDLESNESAAADPKAAVLDRIATARKAWRSTVLRKTPGAVAMLRANVGGRTRVAFGRPRRFAPDLTYAHEGVAIVTADFAAVDDLFYDDTVQSVVVSIVPPPTGGVVSPIVSPMTSTLSTSSQAGGLTVGGDESAWPVVTIDGPVTNPSVEVVGVWTMTLATTIADGEFVTIDTRPWSRGVLRGSGGSLAGAMTGVRISKAQVPPGTYEVVLRGTDATGTASASLSWRDAYTTL